MDTTPEKLVDTIKELGVGYKTTSNSFVFNCPECGGKDKLYMHRKKGFFKCFKCGEENGFMGRPEFALVKMGDLRLPDLVEKLYGISFQFDEMIKIEFLYDPFDYDSLYTDEEPLPPVEPIHFPVDFYGFGRAEFKPGLEYCAFRGVTIEQIKKHNIQYSPKQNRVIFPVWYGNQLFGWQGRYIKDLVVRRANGDIAYKIPKAITSTNLTSGRLLMFHNNTIGTDQIIVCEGPITALHAEWAPGGGAVATLGKQVSRHQIKAIAEHAGSKIYLALDPDAATMSGRIYNTLSELCPSKKIYLMYPPAGKKDLGDCTKEEVIAAYDNATLLESHYIFHYFKEP